MSLKDAVLLMVEEVEDLEFLMYLYAVIRKKTSGMSSADIVNEMLTYRLSSESSPPRGASYPEAS